MWCCRSCSFDYTYPQDAAQARLICPHSWKSVYNGFFQLGEHLKDLKDSVKYKAELLEKHSERWLYGHCDFFAAAYVLDPEYIDHDQLSNEEVMEGFLNVVQKIAILEEARRLQEVDER